MHTTATNQTTVMAEETPTLAVGAAEAEEYVFKCG